MDTQAVISIRPIPNKINVPVIKRKIFMEELFENCLNFYTILY